MKWKIVGSIGILLAPRLMKRKPVGSICRLHGPSSMKRKALGSIWRLHASSLFCDSNFGSKICRWTAPTSMVSCFVVVQLLTDLKLSNIEWFIDVYHVDLHGKKLCNSQLIEQEKCNVTGTHHLL